MTTYAIAMNFIRSREVVQFYFKKKTQPMNRKSACQAAIKTLFEAPNLKKKLLLERFG